MKSPDFYFNNLDDIDFSVCNGCGLCCKIEGYVFVSEQEIKDISDFLNIDIYEFTKKYCKFVGRNKISLVNKKNTNKCIFLKNDNNCSIYKVRPEQCRIYPLYKKAKDLPINCKLRF